MSEVVVLGGNIHLWQNQFHSPKLITKLAINIDWLSTTNNRPFPGSGHKVRNKLHWDANDAVGLSKQRKVGLDW